jgi:hypothetical protein
VVLMLHGPAALITASDVLAVPAALLLQNFSSMIEGMACISDTVSSESCAALHLSLSLLSHCW